MANGLFGGGNGSTTAPYLVEDARDFINVRNRLSAHYRQTQDIDFEGVSYSIFYNFSGSYDGNGFKIKNIKIPTTGSTTGSYWYGIALFGSIQSPSVIQNIHVESAEYTFTATPGNSHTVYMGGIVGQILPGYANNHTPVSNCSFQGKMTSSGTNVNGAKYIGGIIGFYNASNTLKITNCTVNAEMSSIVGYGYLQGISCGMDAYNCHFSGSMEGVNDVVGICDRNAYDCSVSNAIINATGSLSNAMGITSGNSYTQRCTVTNSTITGTSNVVGIGGYTVTNCSLVNSTITNTSSSADRVATGMSHHSFPMITKCLVKDCTITGSVAAGMSSYYHSAHYPTITDSAVIGGLVESKHTSGYAGGMVVNRISDGPSVTINRCYCSANVIGKGTYLAGICNSSSSGSSVKNSFYLGEYIKGLGAKTSSVGLISNLPLSGNTNNYSLDTAQIILE